MVKRKQTNHGELRSLQIPLSVHRYDLTNVNSNCGEHLNIEHLRPFFPPIQKLFKTSELERITEFGIRFNEEITKIVDSSHIKTTSGETREIHSKVTMILNPYKWMRGEYGDAIGLPTSSEKANVVSEKIQNPNNASYVGAIISAVLSQTGCNHFPKVYGVFTGLSLKHTIDISDDYLELSERPWFSQNIGKTFEIKLSENVQDSTEFKHTRTARLSIQLGEEALLGDISEVSAMDVGNVEMATLTGVVRDEEEDDDCSDSSSVSTSYVFNVRSCDCSESDDEEDDEENESFAWATFKNVPVQLTIMEKCVGTLYQLFVLNPDTEKHLAWITQVMFALTYAQRTCGFTHNDLHANNVMYVETKEEYFYYSCGGSLYRVPTYGYLIKIIDFERGVASIKIVGMKEPKLFMSDHYNPEEEAGGQYNYGETYLLKYPEIKPNPSFDLVRLATSIFWDLFPNGPGCSEYSENILFKLFMKWLTLEDGTSVLFSKLEEDHDRYHGFHLYKAIARFCKDAVPRKDIQLLKDIYGVENVTEGVSVLLVD
jgi:hypothetical protein